MVKKAMVCLIMVFIVLGIWVLMADALDVPRISLGEEVFQGKNHCSLLLLTR
jgi:hypothetical protein